MKASIERVAVQFPTYGSRRISAQLKGAAPDLPAVGRERVRRLMRGMGLTKRRKEAGKQTTNSQPSFPRYPNLVKELAVTRPDPVWVCDITYVKVGSGHFVYLAIVMDVFTRVIGGWALSRGLGVELTLAALHRALSQGQPQIHQIGHFIDDVYVTKRIHSALGYLTPAEYEGSGKSSNWRLYSKSQFHCPVFQDHYKDYDTAMMNAHWDL